MQKSFDAAESFFLKADIKLNEAKQQLNKYNYEESVAASRETMELSLKAIFLYLSDEHPTNQEFTDQQFIKAISKAPTEIKNLFDLPRLLLVARFWSNFYTVGKYGHEQLGIGPEHFFQAKETKMALEHAEECHRTVTGLRNWIYLNKT